MGEKLHYMSGFGNEHASEAIAGALPVGQNSPQRPPLGLYTEQISGTTFTAPRRDARRTWLYRIRPSADHPPYRRIDNGLLCSELADPTPNRLRCDPLPMSEEPADFVSGLVTMLSNSDLDTGTGVSVHIYRTNRPMGRVFWNADGELLIVPQQGQLAVATECGLLEVSPGEIAVIPRAIRFRIALPDGQARGYICENHGPALRLPDLGPIGANGLAQPRDFLAPVAWFEDRDERIEVVQKFMGALWATELDHSPLDVVAWHGNHVPYKYDLSRFMTINTVSFDHPDPSIFTVLTSPSERYAGNRKCGFRHLPTSLDGGRAFVSTSVVPSQRDERVHGVGVWRVRCKSRWVRAGRAVIALLHERAWTRCDNSGPGYGRGPRAAEDR